jgi:hypothetical protein
MLVALVYSLLRLFLDLVDVRLRDQDPEAELHRYFPGSVVLHRNMFDMTGPLLSTSEPAGIAATAATSAAKKDIIAWYENQM